MGRYSVILGDQHAGSGLREGGPCSQPYLNPRLTILAASAARPTPAMRWCHLYELYYRMASFTGLEASHWAILSPVITYWIVSGFYELLDTFNLFSQYRIRPRSVDRNEFESRRNLVSRRAVLRHVLTYQGVQTVLLFAATAWFPSGMKEDNTDNFRSTPNIVAFPKVLIELLPLSIRPGVTQLSIRITSTLLLLARQLLALVVLDTWVFWMHYIEHQNTWLYSIPPPSSPCPQDKKPAHNPTENIHAVHHQLYVPFSYGALYNHWFESLCVDGIGGVLGVAIAGLSDHEAICFYALVTAKTVEDHCAFDLPWSPFSLFGRLTGANIVYHNIHHERWGLKVCYTGRGYFGFWCLPAEC